MGTAKKCYNCLSEASLDAAACPRCGARLGARERSGIAAKSRSTLPYLLAAAALLIAGFAASRHHANAAPETTIIETAAPDTAKDAAIRTIKGKGAAELGKIGITDIGYKDDVFCVYADQRFDNLSPEQQRQVLSLVTGDWKKAIGKASTSVKIFKYGTEILLAELTI